MRHLLVVALIVAACGSSDDGSRPVASTPSPATTPAAAPTTTAAPTEAPSSSTGAADIPSQIDRLTYVALTIGERTLPLVAVADSPTERTRGLMFVEDLLDVDGMLFVYAEERFGSFWMKDTLIPLDIAFFDAGGRLVTKLEMEPCDAGDNCPSYSPEGEFQFALETEAGDLAWLEDGDVLLVP
jgi:hypothetical protein